MGMGKGMGNGTGRGWGMEWEGGWGMEWEGGWEGGPLGSQHVDRGGERDYSSVHFRAASSNKVRDSITSV